jgi:hypothetical protein
MRTLALVECWSPRGTAWVALDDPQGPLADRVRRAGGQVVAAGGGPAGVDDLVARHQPDWVVLDGYGFGEQVQSHVRGLGPRLAVVDDHAGHGRYDADAVVDQNLPAT